MDDFVINVKQIGSYPQQPIGSTDLLLFQQGGPGGPYASGTQDQILGEVFKRVNVGILPAPNNIGIASSYLITPLGQRQGFNWYVDQSGIQRYLQNGQAGNWNYDGSNLTWSILAAGSKDAAINTTAWTQVLQVSNSGQLTAGGIIITNPPSGGSSVVTQAWVLANTVNTFNTRLGAVTLNSTDITGAGGALLASPAFTGAPTAPTTATTDSSTNIATTAFVHAAVSAGIAGMPADVSSFNGRTGAVTLTLADITGAGGAPIASPVFTGNPTAPNPVATDASQSLATTAWVHSSYATLTFVNATFAPITSPGFAGVPTAPTATAGTNTSQIATTAFVTAAVTASTTGVSSFNTRTGAVTLNLADVTAVGGAPVANPSFTGIPLAPNPTAGTNNTQIATTAWVTNAIAASVSGVASFNGRTGAVTLTIGDVTGVGGAPLSSPAFLGTPTAPTEPPGTNNTTLATTAFVMAAVAADVVSWNGRTGAVTLQANDLTAVGGALLAGPAFTGVPTAPTATAGTSTTQLATTQFVAQALASAGGVSSFNTRSGAVTLQAADVSNVGGAMLASPTFTGTPLAPTATAGTNNTQIATTAFVAGAIAAIPVGVTSFNTRTGAITLNTADITNAGGALLAGPAFTGVPTAPTATAGTNTTQLATTAFVQAYTPASIPSNIVVGVDADFSVSITLAASDNGKIKNCTAAAGVTVTCPNSLAKDFYCTITQTGAGQVTFAAGSGATLHNRQNLTHTAGQWAICCLLVNANGTGTAASFILGGDCA